MENLSDEYKRGFSEVEIIIQNLSEDEKRKIPHKFLKIIESNKLPGYSPVLDKNKSLGDQGFSKECFSILAVIEYNYLKTTQEEKDSFLNLFK